MKLRRRREHNSRLLYLGAILVGKDSVAERCNEAQQKIANSLAEIVDKVIDKAKSDGSVPHAKFLVDWAELKPAAPEPVKASEKAPQVEENDEPDFAEELLKTLKEMLEEEKQAKAEEAKRAAAGISVP